MPEASTDNHVAALELAHVYRDCVECFGLVHQGRKEWDRAQRLLLAKLGIQQARLLAYGQIMGIWQLGDSRDPRLDEPATRDSILDCLNKIMELPHTTDRAAQFQNYGLRPSKKRVESNEPSLDSARLAAFREQYMNLDNSHAPSATTHHWLIADNVRFCAFIDVVRECVESLIDSIGIQDRVDQALKSDIKALGWHPVFDRNKAANDSSKLRLIKDSCLEDYPEYSSATTGALAYLNKQWQDSYQEAMERLNPRTDPYRSTSQRTTSPTNNSGKYMQAEPKEPLTNQQESKRKRLSIFSIFKKRHSIASIPNTQEKYAFQQSHDAPQDKLLDPERSKSDSAVQRPIRQDARGFNFSNPFSVERTSLDTSDFSQDGSLEPITSMASRHDQFRASV